MTKNPERAYLMLRSIRSRFMAMPDGLDKYDEFTAAIKSASGMVNVEQILIGLGFTADDVKMCGVAQ